MNESLRMLWHSFRYCRTPSKEVPASQLARLIASARLCVLPMTFYAVTIGALLAWLEGGFSWPVYLLILTGFSLAHLADNLLNDVSDYVKGIDRPGYFRALYGPHPIIDGLLPVSTAKRFIAGVLAFNAVLALSLSMISTPLVGLLALIGVVSMALYAGIPVDAKSMGLGEVLVGLVWGPVMAGGTLLAMTGTHPLWALLVYLPFAMAVSLVLIGKHMDKYDQDKAKGVGTLPVRLGIRSSKLLAGLIAIYAPTAAAGALYVRFHVPLVLLPLASYLTATASSLILTREKPETPPTGWRVWPLWYVAAAYAVMDSVGRGITAALLSLGLHLSGHTLAAGIVVALAVALEVANAIPLHRIASYLEARWNK